jgi:hypothetical protein
MQALFRYSSQEVNLTRAELPKVAVAAVQRTLRHTDIKTTLRFYVHADADVQRTALAQVQSLQM